MFNKWHKNRADILKIEELYTRYHSLMQAVSYDILNDHHLAEDAVQQSFINIVNNIHKVDEVNSNRTKNFVSIICTNVSLNIYRNARIRSDNEYTIEDADDELTDNQNDPQDIYVSKLTLQLLTEAIDGLPLIYHDAIMLKWTYGYSLDEIAELTAVSKQTVKKRLTRGKKLLYNALMAEGYHEKQ